MRATQASKTASWVAAARTFGRYLPTNAQLSSDPYGVRFADPWLQRIERAYAARPELARRVWSKGPLGTGTVLYMQLRTRFIDDALRMFAERGGAQVVLLGAGYDSRAVRLRAELPGLRFFEVDHPATQAVKRERLPELADADVRFVSWDFQEQPMSALPATLRAQGLDASKLTLTIWEGVTMYLDPPAIDATLAAVAEYAPAGSPLVFTYMEPSTHAGTSSWQARAMKWLVASVGEPWRFGWSPLELPRFLQSRGFALRADVDARSFAEQMLEPAQRDRVRRDGRRFAIAERV